MSSPKLGNFFTLGKSIIPPVDTQCIVDGKLYAASKELLRVPLSYQLYVYMEYTSKQEKWGNH